MSDAVLISGPKAWFDKAKQDAGAEVAFLFDPSYPRHARRHFGLRPPSGEAAAYVRRAAANARAIADQITGADQKRAQACPTLHRALSVRLEHLASQCRALAAEARTLGHISTAAGLIEQADLLELSAVEIEAELEGA